MADIKDLREQRKKVLEQARAINDAAISEKRELTTEEQANFDQAFNDAEALKVKIEREERLAAAEREAAAEHFEREERKEVKKLAEDSDEFRMAAFDKALRNRPLDEAERRALQFDNNAAGGYLSPPMQFVSQLLKDIDDMVAIRPRATVMQLMGAHSLGVPNLAADPADADWTSEILTGSADSTMSFGRRELVPHPLAKSLLVSNKLLEQSVLPAEQIVRERLAYKFAISEEKAFLTGSGASQPLGVFTASASGISTGQDVSTGNTTTSIQTDGLLEAKYKIKGGYLANAQWLFHRDAVKQIAKLKDGEGRYLWQESVRMGEPDMLLGRPVISSEYAPNTFTTGLYVGLLGDFSYYWIADSLGMRLQRVNELYAATNQVGFFGRMEVDGAPVREEAFARVKLA